MKNNEKETTLRDFKGIWLDKEIWLDPKLNAVEKVILAEIDSLDTEEGCYASNEYLASFCQCSETKVSLAIKKLIELGYVYVENFNGRTRILKSRLSKNERQTFKKLKADFQNLKDINIIDINNKDKRKYKKKVIKTPKWYSEPIPIQSDENNDNLLQVEDLFKVKENKEKRL